MEMDGSQGGSNAPPPFLIKTYDMLEDVSTNSIVSWSSKGKSFIVWNQLLFSRDLLPKYFKHNNFSSFVRQLNTYGFRKVDHEQWEFANDEFIRGKKHLLKNIHRRKPIHSHSLLSSSSVLSQGEKQELEEHIRRLTQERNTLSKELNRYIEERKGIGIQIHSLEERLHQMEYRQCKMIEYLAKVVARPGFISNLFHLTDMNNKKRRLPNPDYFCDQTNVDLDQITSVATREKLEKISLQGLNIDAFEKMESSLDSWENLLHAVCESSGEKTYSDRIMWQPLAIPPNTHVSLKDTDSSSQTISPNSNACSPNSRDKHSSREMTESTSYTDIPSVSSIQIRYENQPKAFAIDVNSKPNSAEDPSSKEQEMRTIASAPTGVNDVFWEQFLTETPGSSETQEAQSAQSERLDNNCSKGEMPPNESGNFCMNRRNIDHITKQMGQLTPLKEHTIV